MPSMNCYVHFCLMGLWACGPSLGNRLATSAELRTSMDDANASRANSALSPKFSS